MRTVRLPDGMTKEKFDATWLAPNYRPKPTLEAYAEMFGLDIEYLCIHDIVRYDEPENNVRGHPIKRVIH